MLYEVITARYCPRPGRRVRPAERSPPPCVARQRDSRITSYNVCYTKLLRDEVLVELFLPGREFTVGILGEAALPVGEIVPRTPPVCVVSASPSVSRGSASGVITSYSIHYTKLYDFGVGGAAVGTGTVAGGAAPRSASQKARQVGKRAASYNFV